MIQRIRLFFLTAALLTAAAFTANAEIDPASIVGAWLFDENAGNTAADSSENGFDGEIVGAQWEKNGVFGSALSFDGGDWVSIPNDPKLQAGAELTYMAYFSIDNLNAHRQLIAKSNEYLLRVDRPEEGNKMSAFVHVNGGWEPRATSVIPELKTWTHFAAVYRADPGANEKSLMIYVDGVYQNGANRPGNIAATENPVTIGKWNNGSHFIGLIDEVAIFDSALSEADILAVKEDGLQAALGGGLAATAEGKMAVLWANLRATD